MGYSWGSRVSNTQKTMSWGGDGVGNWGSIGGVSDWGSIGGMYSWSSIGGMYSWSSIGGMYSWSGISLSDKWGGVGLGNDWGSSVCSDWGYSVSNWSIGSRYVSWKFKKKNNSSIRFI